MTLSDYTDLLLPSIETTLQQSVSAAQGPGYAELHRMLAYHLGWEGKGAGPQATGKRIRPLLVLLSAEAAGGQWKDALPAAAAVELVHNFSLIHDDIQDNSQLRRGRPTLWTKWGIPQAINAGDAMLSLAHLALQSLPHPPEVALHAAHILRQACLTLTQGQYLDLAYEQRGDLDLDSYWPMVTGKTAALMASCTELGALLAGSTDRTLTFYRQFGEQLGLAFQVHDDILGIWGDDNLTGKSTESDLLTGKKSLPVLYALAQNGEFASRWNGRQTAPTDVPELAALLESEGARRYAEETAARLTGQALESFALAAPSGPAADALTELAQKLITRQA